MREDEANVNHVSAATEVDAYSTAAASVMSVNEPNEVATPPQIETGTTVNKDGPALACRQCRTRKVRCDSAKPLCKNCVRRSDPCEYDFAPKRRGPDKQPGTRRRLYKKKPEETTPPYDKSGKEVLATGQRELQGLRRTNRQRHEFSLSVSLNSRETRQQLPRASSTYPVTDPGISSQSPVLIWESFNMGDTTDRTIFDSEESLLALPGEGTFPPDQRTGLMRAYATHQARYGFEVMVRQNHIPRGPSCSFTKQTWWDNLLRLYSDDASQGALKIYQDLSFVLNNSVYWLSCINFPHFMDTLCNPNTRALVQPSVVLSALAVSTMMRSSEVGLGEDGRQSALWLRDAAQSSLDASISASWIEPSLAQAAFFLALFEAALNPTHSAARISSSMSLLDSVIQALSLTKIDAHNPSVTTFPADDMPCVVSPNSQYITLTSQSTDHLNSDEVDRGACTCKKVPILPKGGEWLLANAEYPGSNLDLLLEKEQFSVSPDDSFILEGTANLRPEWPALEDIAEIEKEESRRLCWNSVMLAAFLKDFTPLKLESSTWNFHFTDSKNLALLFPGESVCKTNPKTSVWALHSRASLLWSSCQKLVSAPEWQSRRAELTSKALTEANIIEAAMQKHSCPSGHNLPLGGQGQIMQIKLLASNHFMPATSFPYRFSPHTSNVEQWLAQRARVSRHVGKMSQFLSRFGVAVASRALAKRPLSVWAAMQQIRAGVEVWKSDHSLTAALEQSLQFLPAVDFMSVMWPSEMRRQYSIQLRKDLMECCDIAGISIPAAIQIPGLIELKRKVGLPTPLPAKASFSDILMAPLD